MTGTSQGAKKAAKTRRENEASSGSRSNKGTKSRSSSSYGKSNK